MQGTFSDEEWRRIETAVAEVSRQMGIAAYEMTFENNRIAIEASQESPE